MWSVPWDICRALSHSWVWGLGTQRCVNSHVWFSWFFAMLQWVLQPFSWAGTRNLTHTNHYPSWWALTHGVHLLHLGFYSFQKTMLCQNGKKKKIPATSELPSNCVIVTKSQCLLSDFWCVSLRWDRQEGGSGALCHLQMLMYVELVKAQGVIVARFKIVDTDTGHLTQPLSEWSCEGWGQQKPGLWAVKSMEAQRALTPSISTP